MRDVTPGRNELMNAIRSLRRSSPLAHRVGWGVVDQAVSSLTNFGLMVLAARNLSVEGFGIFSLVFATYGVFLSMVRSLVIEALVVRFSAVSEAAHREASRAATGAVLVLAVFGAFVCFVVGAQISGATGRMVTALAVILPGLLLQDTWRSVFFAAGRPAQAAANEVVWMFVQVGLYIALFVAMEPTATELMLAWGGAASVAAAVGARQFRLWPAPHLALSWWKQHRDLGKRFAAEQATSTASQQVTVFAIAGVAGLGAVGAIRAAQVVIGPLTMLALASTVVAVPEGVRVASGLDRLRRGALLLSGGLLVVALVYTAAVLLLPDTIGEQLLGESWASARSQLLPVAAGFAGYMASIGARTALRALGAAAESLRAKLVTSLLSLVIIVAGAAMAGASGAAAGIAFSGWLQAAVNWLVFTKVQANYGRGRSPISPTTSGQLPD